MKAEREVAMLKDQAQCYEENTSKLKGKLLSLIYKVCYRAYKSIDESTGWEGLNGKIFFSFVKNFLIG